MSREWTKSRFGQPERWSLQYQDGFFAFPAIPRQFAVVFVSVPGTVPDFPWVKPLLLGGPTILRTSSTFLWAFKARRPDLFNLGAWASVALIFVPVLTYADTGAEQFGYRYAQDVYPFLFLLTVRGLGQRISPVAWSAIALGLVVNVWGWPRPTSIGGAEVFRAAVEAEHAFRPSGRTARLRGAGRAS
ncbi:MAG TPA: hypothetical protein VIM30_06105 [Candidatus Limnocylindrales bacterium]